AEPDFARIGYFPFNVNFRCEFVSMARNKFCLYIRILFLQLVQTRFEVLHDVAECFLSEFVLLSLSESLAYFGHRDIERGRSCARMRKLNARTIRMVKLFEN